MNTTTRLPGAASVSEALYQGNSTGGLELPNTNEVAPPDVSPFNGPIYDALRETWTVVDAVAEANKAREAARKGNPNLGIDGIHRGDPEYTAFDEMYPKGGSVDDRESSAVRELWLKDEPIYPTTELHKALRIKETHSNWRWRLALPPVLTGFQVWYLTNHVMRHKYPNFIDVLRPKHPVQPGVARRRGETKVGNVYGTWKFTKCLDPNKDERTTRNRSVYYEAVCTNCGYVKPKLDYRRMSNPCPACSRIGRYEKQDDKRIDAEEPLKASFTLYRLDDGSLGVFTNRPANAVGYIEVTHKNKPMHVQLYDAVVLEQVQDSDPDAEIKAAQDHEAEKLALRDKLMRDMPPL